MIAAMLCMCIPVIGPPAYAEEGDPIQDPVYMEEGASVQEPADTEDGESVQEPADAEEEKPVQDPASDDDAESDSRDLTAPSNDDTETFIHDSKRAHSSEIISIDEDFTTADNKTLKLTMTGLTDANKGKMLKELRESFRDSGEGADEPIRVVDDSFIDAEKWDVYAKPLPEYSEYYYGYDTYHCWAAACSNMLWISGWAEGLTNPITRQPFKSEDDIFEYYNVSFSDQGGDSDRGIDWFFMGEFCQKGFSNGSHTMHDPSGGLMTSFVSSVAQRQYDLVENPSDIERMLRVYDPDPADRSVFQVTPGSLDAGELSTPLHAITGIGLITDPEAGSMAEKYKAIVLIDSDNDAKSSEEERAEWEAIMRKFEGTEPFSQESNAVMSELVQHMNSGKEIRPNSYTVYKLRYSTDINGTPYWEIVKYDESNTTALYNLDELPYPSEKVLADCEEKAGTKNVNLEVDLTLDELFTTSNAESVPDPFTPPAAAAKKDEFGQGDPVNINYFLTNRSNAILDDSYPSGNVVAVDWTVTRDSDGSTVASGSTSQEFNIYSKTETGAMLYLNKSGSGYEKWQPGAYTVTVSFNKDRKILESYYRNNFDRTLHFTVTEKAAPEDTDDGSQDSDSPQKDSGPQKENVKKTADTLKNPVRTGDEANPALWMLTAVLAAAAFAVIITIKIRRSR